MKTREQQLKEEIKKLSKLIKEYDKKKDYGSVYILYLQQREEHSRELKGILSERKRVLKKFDEWVSKLLNRANINKRYWGEVFYKDILEFKKEIMKNER